jgi:hypothetical protein
VWVLPIDDATVLADRRASLGFDAGWQQFRTLLHY